MVIFFYFLFFILSTNVNSRSSLGAERYEPLTGKSLQKDLKGQWDLLYGRSGFVYGKKPAKFLSENYHLIKERGRVLDVGMGEGRNAVYLSSKGFNVTGIDISSVAIKKAEILAKEFRTSIQTIVADAQKYDFKENTFDAIICFYYVDRSLILKLKKWLKPKGYIFYEAYTLEHKLKIKNNQDPDAYYLQKGEPASFFKDFFIIKDEYFVDEKESKASLVARKR